MNASMIRHGQPGCLDCAALDKLSGGQLSISVAYRTGSIYVLGATLASWAEFFELCGGYTFRISAGKHGFGATVYMER